jgi:transcriptional regulator with XRE-family HTH domain
MAKQQLPSEMKVLAGLRLRAARMALGVQSEKAMAATLGVSANAYNNYECGTRLVDVAMAVRLLETTGIGPDWIYAGSTTGVPFDRAQALRAILRQLVDAGSPPTNAPTKPKGPEPPPGPPEGGHVEENEVCRESGNVLPLKRRRARVPA